MEPQVQLILSQTSPSFWLALYKKIRASYQDALDYFTIDFPKEITFDAIAPHRRALIEKDIYKLAQEFDYEVKFKPNKTKNAFHAEVTAGNLIITQHFNRYDTSNLHPTLFQFGLAKENNSQIYAFEGVLDNPTATSSSYESNQKFYVSVYHGSDERLPKEPSYVHVGFPRSIDEENVSLKFEPILISKLYSNLNPDPIEPTKISDEAIPTLKNIEYKQSKNI